MRSMMVCFMGFVVAAMIVRPAVCPGQQDELPPPRTSSPDSVQQQLADQMVDELAGLIPGGSLDQIQQRQQLLAVVKAFLAGDENGTRFRLKQLSESVPDFPPDDLLLAGMAFVAGNPVQGKILLERAGNVHRNHPGIALAFGRLALSQGRLYDAQALMEKADEINNAAELLPASKKFYAAAVLNSLTAIEVRRSALDRAEQLVRQWEELAPDDDGMLMAAAEVEFLQKRDAQAIQYLNRRGSESRDQIPTEILLGRWYRNRDDLENYGKWISDAYEKYPGNAFCQLEYAAWLLRKEDFDAVEEVIEDYEARHGESNDSSNFRGRIAFARQQYDTAETYFGKVFQAQPNSFESSFLYVLSLLESGDPQKYPQAINLARRNQQLFPDNQLALACLGWAYWKTNQAELAKQLLTRASEMGESLPDTVYFLARTMYDQNQKTRAKVILDPLLDSPEVFLYRSLARQLVEQIDQN